MNTVIIIPHIGQYAQLAAIIYIIHLPCDNSGYNSCKKNRDSECPPEAGAYVQQLSLCLDV